MGQRREDETERKRNETSVCPKQYALREASITVEVRMKDGGVAWHEAGWNYTTKISLPEREWDENEK
jgi:hypothetical protein